MQIKLNRDIRFTDLLPVVMLLVGLYLFPFSIVDCDFSRIPGDKGDARFNNYILEHGYKYFKGEVKSYWDAPFMYPYKNTIAFSDNLLGTLPVYAFFRSQHCDRETAFQWWFITLFALNFLCCYWALKRWSKSTLISSTGAYVYAFSIFILCHINHVQVFPRFMIPLVIYWTWRYLKDKSLKHLFLAMLGLTFQFYCGIYLGFFLVYVLLFMIVSYLLVYRDKDFFTQFKNLKIVGVHLLIVCFNIALLYPMFKPYMEVSGKFGYRHFEEVSMYIPTWRAYFSSTPESAIWRFLSWHIRSQGWMWWEQFLFIGGLPWIAVLLLPFIFLKRRFESDAKKFLGFLLLTFFLCFIFSLKIDGFTLYKIIFNLPGYGSMRSINRLINAEVIFQILLMVFVFKYLWEKYPVLKKYFILLPLLVIIDNSVSYWERTFKKSDVQADVARVKEFIRSQLDTTKAAIAYQHFNFAGLETESHLNVMLATQEMGLACVNAYTGLFPYNYQGFADGEGMDSLKRWMDYNHAGINDIQIVSEFGVPYVSRRFGMLSTNEGKFLKVNHEKGDRVFADSPTKEEGEFFELSTLPNGFTVIRASNGKYLCAEIAATGDLVANRDKPGEWEQFVLTETSVGCFSFKAANGKYLQVNPDRALVANSDMANAMNEFRLEKK